MMRQMMVLLVHHPNYHDNENPLLQPGWLWRGWGSPLRTQNTPPTPKKCILRLFEGTVLLDSLRCLLKLPKSIAHQQHRCAAALLLSTSRKSLILQFLFFQRDPGTGTMQLQGCSAWGCSSPVMFLGENLFVWVGETQQEHLSKIMLFGQALWTCFWLVGCYSHFLKIVPLPKRLF